MTSMPTRRQLLQLAVTAPLALGKVGRADAAPALEFPPAAFDATQDSALIWVCGDETARVRVDVAEDAPESPATAGPVVSLTKASNYCAAVRLTPLAPGKTWTYRVFNADSGKPLSEPGRFKTPPAAAAPFTFAFSADMEETYRPFKLFDAIAARQPDFFLHLGDTVYADHPKREFSPSVSHYRRRHQGIRKDRHLQRFLARHVTYAIWDDHEIENHCHADHPHLATALQVFREYWPCQAANPEALYRRFSWASVDFFILDTRRFRSPQTMEDGAAKTMLGAVQKRWLTNELKASTAPFKFIVTSVPFHGGGADTWGVYRTERDELARFIRDEKIGGAIFLTGDYHLARDWTNARTGLREFMAGPIASFVHYQRTPDARERYAKAGTFHYGDGYNFGLWRVDPSAGRATLEFVGAGGEPLGRIELTA